MTCPAALRHSRAAHQSHQDDVTAELGPDHLMRPTTHWVLPSRFASLH
ncbi:MAG: hypothetical protein ACRDRP_23120 [Pseudonocardiaceae bacterium]